MAMIWAAIVCLLSMTYFGAAVNPVVNTTLGLVEGLELLVANTTLNVFYGIPFAKPPVGNLRFKRPETPERWNGTKQTEALAHSCHQTIDELFGKHRGVDMWNANTPMSEDCLYINVWQPKHASSSNKLPVMVWIFGGSFALGSNTMDVYNGRILAGKNDVVVVSMNYRVGVLGFMSLFNDDSPGNVGLLDQSLALKWVHENIEQFGGDATQITIFGESAGAASVHMHMLSTKSRDYFNRAIMQSSTGLCYWALQSKEVAMERAKLLGEKVSCSYSSLSDLFECLLKTDAQTLVTEQWNVLDYYFDVPFAPVVDGYFLTDHPQKLVERGETKNCSILLGVDKNEGSYFLLYGIPQYFKLNNTNNLTEAEFQDAEEIVLSSLNTTLIRTIVDHVYEGSVLNKIDFRDVLDDISGEYAFKCPVVDLARAHSALGNDVYLYSFDYRMEKLPWPQWMGVPHGYEIELVFGLPLNSSFYGDNDYKVSVMTMYMWSQFSKTGKPSDQWPLYDENTQAYLKMKQDTEIAIEHGLRHPQCALWREVIPVLQRDQDTKDPPVNASRSTVDVSCLILLCVVSSVGFYVIMD